MGKIKQIALLHGTTLWRAAVLLALIWIGLGIGETNSKLWQLLPWSFNRDFSAIKDDVSKMKDDVSDIKSKVSLIESDVSSIRLKPIPMTPLAPP